MPTTMPHLIRTVTTSEDGGGSEPQVEETTGTDETQSEESPSRGDEPASDDSPQEGFDADRALAKIRKANAEAEALRKRAKAAEAKAASIDDVTRERDALALRVRQLDVAAEYGLPGPLAERLRGDTPEEMKKDAEELLALFERRTPPSQTPRTNDQAAAGVSAGSSAKEPTIEEIGARMFRR